MVNKQESPFESEWVFLNVLPNSKYFEADQPSSALYDPFSVLPQISIKKPSLSLLGFLTIRVK